VRLGLPVLLAPRLREVGGIILHAHDDLEVATRVGRFRRERRVPALVTCDMGARDPGIGAVVDGSEVDQQTPARRMPGRFDLGCRHRAAVPHHAVEPGVADAGG
jgi:hypothetical protein